MDVHYSKRLFAYVINGKIQSTIKTISFYEFVTIHHGFTVGTYLKNKLLK